MKRRDLVTSLLAIALAGTCGGLATTAAGGSVAI